jgi:hypothetical protein
MEFMPHPQNGSELIATYGRMQIVIPNQFWGKSASLLQYILRDKDKKLFANNLTEFLLFTS